MKKPVITIALCIFLLGCSGDVHLYNMKTGEQGAFKYHYRADGNHGTMAGNLGAETFAGEYSLVANAAVGWGSIYGSGGSAGATTVAVGGRRYGAAVLTGSNHSVLDCEFTVGSLNAHGTGTCKSNGGELYRMMF